MTLNPAIDRLIFVNEALQKGKTNRIERVLYDIGGKGIHGSYTMGKLGVENQALGFVGLTNQPQLYELLRTKSIQHDFIELPNVATRECYVVREAGLQGSTMFTEKGFQVDVQSKIALQNKVAAKVKAHDMVLIAGSLPENYSLAQLSSLIQLLKSKNCYVACDLSGEALKTAVSLGVDFIKPNFHELTELVGAEEDIQTSLKKLHEKVPCIVASRGKEGSYCIYQEKVYHVQAPEVVEKNDTGAGDCFVGAFLAQLSQKKSMIDCLKLATGCAASKVQQEDCSSFNVAKANELAEKVVINKL